MEAKAETCNSQKFLREHGDGSMGIEDMLTMNDLRKNNMLCDAVLRFDDGSTLSVHRVILSVCSEYFRFVWLIIWLILTL
jgi:kelch-like protein 10